MSAIITKYLPATNARGSRVTAKLTPGWGGGATDRVTLNWDYSLTGWQNHVAAAEALARKLELWGLFLAVDAGTSGYLFVRRAAISAGFEAAPDLIPVTAAIAGD